MISFCFPACFDRRAFHLISISLLSTYLAKLYIYGKNNLRGEKDERVEPSQQRVTVEITFSKVRTEKKSFSFLFSFSFSKIFFKEKKLRVISTWRKGTGKVLIQKMNHPCRKNSLFSPFVDDKSTIREDELSC